MATVRAHDAPSAAPDYGPSLPALVRRHFGVRESVTAAAAAAIVAAIAIGVLLHSATSGPVHLVHRAGPTFNLQYPDDLLHRVNPRGDELVRLEARRGRLTAAIWLTRLELPPYPGNVTSGLLPVYENTYERTLRRTLPAFVQRDEGSARVGDAPGYQIGFRSGPAGRFTWGRDILLVPRDEDVREGVVLHFRYAIAGKARKREQKALDSLRKALYSFNFGTEPAA